MNLGLLLEMVAEGAPERVVIGPRGSGLTASGLLGLARSAAACFQSCGCANVAFLDLNSEALPVSLFGAVAAGLPFAPLNYRLPDDRLAALIRRLAPAVVVVGGETASRVEGLGAPPDLKIVRREEVLAPAARSVSGAAFSDPDSVAVVLFTSGTTGEPKAALLRHRHLASYILSSVELLSAGEDEAQLVSVPPYHVAGVASVLSCVYAGRRLVYLEAFEERAWVEAVQRERVTHAMVVPTMLARVVAELEASKAELPSLRHLAYGGGRAPVATLRRAMELLPDVGFVNAYGLTETSSTITVLTPEDHREAARSADPQVRARLGSVGRPVPAVEVSIRGPAGEELPAGERGEVWVRGEQVAGEYLGQAALQEGGWFATRDAGWLDPGGYLFLDGRLDDVIVRGGENLSPGEIEEVLEAHPAVAAAGVAGIPDAEWGEAVAAAVVLAPGMQASVEELQSWVRERLRSTRVPKVIQFRDDLPYNETGKLVRRALREELAGA